VFRLGVRRSGRRGNAVVRQESVEIGGARVHGCDAQPLLRNAPPNERAGCGRSPERDG
jgi:hypothetical protein